MSCLFISLGKLLNIDPSILRNQICDYIIANPDAEWDGTKLSEWIQMVAGDRCQNVSQYINIMRNHSQWGGAPEIAVCCMIYNVAVEIVNLRQRSSPNILFKNSKQSSGSSGTSGTSGLSGSSGTSGSSGSCEKYWEEYENNLYKQFPGLIKMRYFHNTHPLRQNYENFMKHKKQDFLEKQKYLMRNNRAPNTADSNTANSNTANSNVAASNVPLLTISWTGVHYEPVSIKNHHH